MTSMYFHNANLRTKTPLSVARDGTVNIECIDNSQLHSSHIKRLRQSAVLALLTTWLELQGYTVKIHNTRKPDSDIVITDDIAKSNTSLRELPHCLTIGEILVSRTANQDEDLYCVKNIRAAYHEEVLRLFLLRSQYRTSIQFTKMQIEDASRSLDRLYRTLKAVPPGNEPLDPDQVHVKRFIAAMNDDLNMQKAFAAINDLANAATSAKSTVLSSQLRHLGKILNILQMDPSTYLHRPATGKRTSDDSKWNFMKRLDVRILAA